MPNYVTAAVDLPIKNLDEVHAELAKSAITSAALQHVVNNGGNVAGGIDVKFSLKWMPSDAGAVAAQGVI